MTPFDILGRVVSRLRGLDAGPIERAGEGGAAPRSETETYTTDQLREFLHCWTLPGGTLPPDQARALLAWSGTPEQEREPLKASIAATHQQVEAQRLAPNQRRGHVSRLDRLKHLLGR